jgi:protein TonB
LSKRFFTILFLVAFPFGLALYSQNDKKTPTPSTQETAPPKPAVPRVRMGGKIMTKMLKRKVTPEYPKEARDQRIQGTVQLHIIVGKDGKVLQAELISGHPVFAQAALEAVRKWEYKPVLLNGEAVEVDTTVDIVFSFVQ